ncbi:MAG: hypothetical protein EXR18_01165 [Flavobacteriaceae bacterium]|nr:hypothetical protein [Flavobacteriaceae bacterium]
MKLQNTFLLIALLLIFSCKDNKEERLIENAKDAKKKETIFNIINKGWNFNSNPINPASQGLVAMWPEWRGFLMELNSKPKSTIGAFQKKARELSKKVAELNNNIPIAYNNPEVKSRIAVLISKINSLNLYINLDEIPDQKVVALVSEINIQLISLQSQLDEIVRKSTIPKEEGESDLIKMLDPSRAIPTR